MPRLVLITLLAIACLGSLTAQTPQPRLSYEDRAGTTGHVLVIDGKTFGPYKDVSSVTHSTSGTAGLFLVTKRDKTYVLAQGRESGPLAAGFDPNESYVSDDGKLVAILLSEQNTEDEGTGQTQLWVNGKVIGSYLSVYPFEYAEQGGGWIAAVQTGDEEYDVLLNGKSQGPFSNVDKVWMSPDGKSWGYAVRNTEGNLSIVTQDKKYGEVPSGYFDDMNPRNAHWAYSIRTGDEAELIVVDGKEFRDYLNFGSLIVTTSGRHWGFEAERLADAGDYPVVVVDGKEYVGEGLNTTSLGSQEWFTWSVNDGAKVTVQVLALP